MRLAGKRTDGKPGEVLAKLELERNSVPGADGIATQAGWIQKARLIEDHIATTGVPVMGEIGGERSLNHWRLHDNRKAPADKRPIQKGGVFAADMNEYGEGDIFITDVSGPALNLALGSGKSKDATAGSGIPTELKGIGAVALADFDNDGHVDMVLPRLVHFGFGSAARIEKLTIRWPSGEVQEFQNPAPDRRHRSSRGQQGNRRALNGASCPGITVRPAITRLHDPGIAH